MKMYLRQSKTAAKVVLSIRFGTSRVKSMGLMFAELPEVSHTLDSLNRILSCSEFLSLNCKAKVRLDLSCGKSHSRSANCCFVRS